MLLVDRGENFVLAAVRPARTVVGRLVDVGATARGYRKLGRVSAPLPQGWRLEAGRPGQFDRLFVQIELVFVRAARLHLVGDEMGRPGFLFARLVHVGIMHRVGLPFGPVGKEHDGRTGGLYPEHDFAHLGIAHHGPRLQEVGGVLCGCRLHAEPECHQ